jgi:hypothetical protein
VEDSFQLLFKDPVLYAFAAIVIVSTIILLYNMNRKRFIEFDNNNIVLGNKYNLKKIYLDQIEEIKIFKKRKIKLYSLLRTVTIKLKNKKRILVVRTSDYENEEELIEQFNNFKNLIESKNV